MQPESGSLRDYRQQISAALNDQFLRQAMDNFAVAYRGSRQAVFEGLDPDAMAEAIADMKDRSLGRLEALFDQFKQRAESNGITVHWARDADQANQIIADIAAQNKVRRIIKSKSMTAEETLLNHFLEARDLEVTETDLGEWIVQLRHEGPSHMVMPAIHLSRYQVGDLFSSVTGQGQFGEDIDQMVKVARRELRKKFLQADMGISGANFAIADTATIGLVTNEGNARLVTTLPPVHVALIGLEKLVPTLADALRILKILPRNATGQFITSYVTWITGPAPCAIGPDGNKQMHVVFLDNGRMAVARDPEFRDALRCVRCGACANVCPVYRMVGGHRFGHIYIGAIGLLLTCFYHGEARARQLLKNCINCGACKSVCAAGIDLPRLIKSAHRRVIAKKSHPLKNQALSLMLKNRRLFHGMLRSARMAQQPVKASDGFLRHLPHFLLPEHQFRALPAIADVPFRDIWKKRPPRRPDKPLCRVALFGGCVQDFVYPEQLEAAVRVLTECNVAIDFPDAQSCCGLPLEMMGERAAAQAVAGQNVGAIDPDAYDYIVTLCASCASHLTHGYPRLIVSKRAERFIAKVMPFSRFMADVIDVPARRFAPQAIDTTWHAPCHLCRGLGIRQAPETLIKRTGATFLPATEAETCCGFGGSYSVDFPLISAHILDKKMADFQQTGADRVITECPGCILQLRGGFKNAGIDMPVMHLAELLDEHWKPKGGT